MFTYFSFISWDIHLGRVTLVQYLPIWVKCTLVMIYNQFPKTSYTQQMMVFKSWIRMIFNDFLCILFYYSYIISAYSNLGRNIFVQNIITWVWCTLSMIYNQFPKTSYTQKMIVFESWIKIVNNEVIWIIFTFHSFISGDIHLKRGYSCPNPHNLSQMNTINYL